jgi:parvulin-like peptidyl-prolyl isomerase
MRLTEPEFEDRIRRDLIIQKMSQLVSLVGKDVQIVDQFDKKIEQAQVNIAYIKMSPDTMKSAVKSSEVKELLSTGEERLKSHFDSQSRRYQSPAEVRARHILIKAEGEEDGERKAALEKAEKLKKTATRLNFKQLAQQHSDDPGSKAKGGDLGFFSQGKMVPEFEQAAFAAEPGEIVGPVESQFGYHLILVEEKKAAVSKEFAQVREEIARELVAKQKQEALVSQMNQMLSTGQPQKVEELVSQNGLQWTTTGFFSVTRENIPGVGNNAEFVELATSLSSQREYPARVLHQGETAYLLKFKGANMNAPALANEQQMDFFKQLMRQQRVNGLVQSWADSLRSQAKIKVNAELLGSK